MLVKTRLGVLEAATFKTPNGVEVPMPRVELEKLSTRKSAEVMVEPEL